MTRQESAPLPEATAEARAHDQLRDARDGIERSGRSDKAQRTPNERDEAPDRAADGERQPIPDRHVMRQAAADLERGLEDTEARGTPSNPPSAADNRGDADNERTTP